MRGVLCGWRPARRGPGRALQAPLRQGLGRDFSRGPTMKAERGILLASPFLISRCFMFSVLCFPCRAASRADSAGSQGAAACRSSGVHVTQARLPGQSEQAGEIRWNISHVLLASLQSLSIISLCAGGAVLVWHLKGMLGEDFTTSCHFTVQNRCGLITHGNLCLCEPLPLPSLGAYSRVTPGWSIMRTL